ncbi:MAG: helix-turn-helix domain-containing protein [Chthoniobacteraceae bacterium]
MFIFYYCCKDCCVPSQKPIRCPQRAQFGKNVHHLRIGAGLTQEALAEATGVSARYIQSIEAGEYFPALPTLAKLKKGLKTTWNKLLEGCEG